MGSCRTCRRRHVRCDTQRPTCQTCLAVGLTCEGFSNEIRWASSRKRTSVYMESGPIARFGVRHYVLTEEDRRSMTAALSKDLLLGSVDASLEEIDTRSRTPCFRSEQEARIGPFAVLHISALSNKLQDTQVPCLTTEPPADEIPSIQTSNASIQTVLDVSPAPVDPFLQWDLGSEFPALSAYHDLEFQSTFDCMTSLHLNGPLTDQPLIAYPTFDDDEGCDISSENTAYQQTLTHQSYINDDILKNAPELLKHFQTNVIPQMTVIPLSKKSPWDIVNIPAALLTLGSLTIMNCETVTHARQAHLYSLLACSAIDLATNPSKETTRFSREYWEKLAEQCYAEAKSHIRISLSEETGGPRKAKLKDQLMALYGMIKFTVFSGQHRDARCYLVDAERLLRVRGLPKRKISRRMRLLLNIYTWLRISGESTYVLHDYTLLPSALSTFNLHCQSKRPIASGERPILSHVQGVCLDDCLHIEKRNITDIHLQDSRKSSETLSKQVYGIPEIWLSLLSQTTRLANIMDILRNSQNTEITMSCIIYQALQDRASRLERVINDYTAREIEPNHRSEQTTHDTLIFRALNSALIIFFHRRVRQTYPALLEGEVEKAITSLLAFYRRLKVRDPLGLGTLWPLFIAGCEVITHRQRESILYLLAKANLMSGLAPYKIASDLVTEVWRRQDEQLTASRQAPLPSWIDISKERAIFLLVSFRHPKGAIFSI
ncbi:fungal-specific transcription factor domain-containing protein [Aspergillus pseudonomiae]|uniref:Fungal-specific transcription factor domain-containing protein n=1 Tax=Aspergillus pseudonomiae TaxID=1506151 RepID=A0A5N7DPW0_9EURO|nr:fungal-specific transcription factor domain-containing protein [Aspergillus pseudonomiae]KAB8259425.1 fungal-specific transcription factor domain-containing protein [Aspergillus pseudonomiae]KAE8408345.1 fungal-specific transcription factor domain-containing protein [Aspergillus pseudonomiae]